VKIPEQIPDVTSYGYVFSEHEQELLQWAMDHEDEFCESADTAEEAIKEHKEKWLEICDLLKRMKEFKESR
jgi:hypothetical protein